MAKKQTQSLIEAVRAAPGESVTRTAAWRCLRSDWGELETRQDFGAAYHGLRCCLELLGRDKEYRRLISEMRKLLADIESARLKWLAGPEEREAERHRKESAQIREEIEEEEFGRQFWAGVKMFKY